MAETVLVTGGAGFIGSHLAHGLVRKGYQVRVIDNLHTGRPEYLADIKEKISFLEGDITDFDFLRGAFRDVDFVLHHAALRSVSDSVKNPREYCRVNISGTLNVLEAARQNNVRRLVFASSSAVYGDSPEMPQKESMLPDPKNPYAHSKLCGEHYCAMYSSLYGLEAVSLRYFNAYGPGQDPDSEYSLVIPVFVDRILNGRKPELWGDGKQSRDFVYIDDVVSSAIAAMKAGSRVSGRAINIAGGKDITLNELIEKINSAIGKDIKPVRKPFIAGDVKRTLGDITLAKELLGWKPEFSFAEGIRKTIEWHREKGAC
jgi:nucleoside-diphosphate-sugar epimerase